MRDILDIDEKTLRSFRWPSYMECDGNYSNCRYLADYIVKDQNGKKISDMFVNRKSAGSWYIAEGTLLARPGTNEVSICDVIIPFEAYSIDFSEVGSAQRGYWIESNINYERVFYKLVRPSGEYRDQADKMELKVSKFLQLYDYISMLKHLFNKKGFIECDMTIQQLHSSSQGSFDLDFIKQNGALVLLNLVNSLQELKCVLLIDSVRELASLDRKMAISFFPKVTQKSFMKALEKSTAKNLAKSPMSVPEDSPNTSGDNSSGNHHQNILAPYSELCSKKASPDKFRSVTVGTKKREWKSDLQLKIIAQREKRMKS